MPEGDVADGNVEGEDDGEEVDRGGLDAGEEGALVGGGGEVVVHVGAHSVEGHVERGEEEGVFEVHGLERRLVEEGHPDVVHQPDQEPETPGG